MNSAINLLFGLCMVVLLLGCAPVEESSKASGEVMKIHKIYWPGAFWIEIAYEKGWFEEAGLNVELVDVNTDYVGSLENLADGKMDINLFTLYDLVDFHARGHDVVMIINEDMVFDANAIVSKKEISKVSELKGKRVGVDLGSFLEYLFVLALKSEGLILEDVIVVDMNGEMMPEEFIQGNIDAFIGYNPYLTEGLEKGSGRIIWDTSHIPGVLPEGSTVRKTLIEERSEDVQTFVDVWYRTTEFIKDNQKEAFDIIATNYNQTPGDVQSFADEVKFLDLKANRIAFSYAAGFESLHGTARQINSFMINNGLTDKNLDSTEFIDARFIRGVKE